MKFKDLSGALKIVVTAMITVTLYARFGPHDDSREQRVLEYADSLRTVAETQTRKADSLSVEAAKDSASVLYKYLYITAQHDSAKAVPLPPTCDTSCVRLVAERDTTIDTLKVIATHWQDSYRTQLAAYALLKSANASLLVANDSLVAVIKDRPRHTALSKVLVGVGVAATAYGIAKDELAVMGAGVGILSAGVVLR